MPVPVADQSQSQSPHRRAARRVRPGPKCRQSRVQLVAAQCGAGCSPTPYTPADPGACSTTIRRGHEAFLSKSATIMSLAVHKLGVLLRAPRTWVLAPLVRPGRGAHGGARALSSSPASSPAPAPTASESGRRVLESPFGKDLLPPKDTLIQHLWKDGCVWEEKKFLVSGIATNTARAGTWPIHQVSTSGVRQGHSYFRSAKKGISAILSRGRYASVGGPFGRYALVATQTSIRGRCHQCVVGGLAGVSPDRTRPRTLLTWSEGRHRSGPSPSSP